MHGFGGHLSHPAFCINSAPWRRGDHSSGEEMDSKGPAGPLGGVVREECSKKGTYS